MTLGIIIVNYKTAELTINCLRTLALEQGAELFTVIVVDNDSQDGSFEILTSAVSTEGWSAWVKVVASGYNGGFAYGNNIAIREFMATDIKPDYFYLLNPDAYVTEGAVHALIDFMDENPRVGIVGSKIIGEDGVTQQSAFDFHMWLTELNRGFSLGILNRALSRWLPPVKRLDKPSKTDWVSGASMMIRCTLFEQVGLMDEDYFMYYEETDFCFQASKAGWECWHVPESIIVHLVGQSSGIIGDKPMQKRMPRYWFDSRRRYFLKNFGAIHTLIADSLFLVGFTTWKGRNLIQKKQDTNPPGFLYDSFVNSVFVRGFKLLLIKKNDNNFDAQ